MTGFTATQIRYILKLLAEKHGPGYADSNDKLEDGSSVGSLQAGLSMMLQVTSEREAMQEKGNDKSTTTTG